MGASVADNVTENRITFNIADTTSEGLGISTIDLDSLGEAQSAINYLDAAIQKVNDERSNIGSLQNRFEFTSSNLLNSEKEIRKVEMQNKNKKKKEKKETKQPKRKIKSEK